MSPLPARRDVTPMLVRRREPAAVGFARSQRRAIASLVAGALLLPVILAASWLKTGQLHGLAIGVAVGASTLFDLVGVAGLVLRKRAMQRYRARVANKETAGPPLQVHFCRRSLGRLGTEKEPLLDALRERGHVPTVRECLNCCQDCNRGMLVTMVDGTPMSAADGTELLGELDELAASS